MSLADTAGESELDVALHQRAIQLAEEHSGVTLLVDWKIDCGEALRHALRHGLLARTLEIRLRDDFGRRAPSVWTVRIDAEVPDTMPNQWREEETMRGDFLRLVDTYRIHSPPSAELPALIDPHEVPRELSESVGSICRLLPDAAWLGASLLSPEEVVR